MSTTLDLTPEATQILRLIGGRTGLTESAVANACIGFAAVHLALMLDDLLALERDYRAARKAAPHI